jgi:hypothetical protein
VNFLEPAVLTFACCLTVCNARAWAVVDQGLNSPPNKKAGAWQARSQLFKSTTPSNTNNLPEPRPPALHKDPKEAKTPSNQPRTSPNPWARSPRSSPKPLSPVPLPTIVHPSPSDPEKTPPRPNAVNSPEATREFHGRAFLSCS